MTTHDLDVVIPTRDRPDQLLTTLQALTRQSHTGFGVVVVDDGSAVEVRDRIPQSLRDSLRIRTVRNPVSLGAGAARNRGVSTSDARYIVLIDDDCIAGPHLIRGHYQALSSTDEPVVSLGPIHAFRSRRLPVWSLWDAEHLERGYRQLETGQATPSWEYLFTGNVGLRKADFLAIGGFDERLARNEDVELGYRLDRYGCRFEFDSEATVFHDCQRSLRSWRAIAAAAAVADVDMQRCDPGSQRMALVGEQLQAKHWALRLVRNAFGGRLTGRAVAAAAMGCGFLLHATHANRPALLAFSVVHDLTYWQSLQQARAQLTPIHRVSEEVG